MASQLEPPATYATVITDIGDDLLREVFLRLPSLPSLVRAALACRTFLRAVRSCPALRRRFRALHPPQLLGIFVGRSSQSHPAIPPFVPLRRRSDPDLAAAIRGSDFLLTRLPAPEDRVDAGWAVKNCRSGYVLLYNHSTRQIAAYNPVTQALDIFPQPPQETCQSRYLKLRILPSDDQCSFFRLVYVHRRHTEDRVSVFSSDSRDWQCFPWVKTSNSKPQPAGDDDDGTSKCVLSSYAGTLAKEFDRLVYWRHKAQPYLVLLDTATMQLSLMDLPPPLKHKKGRKKIHLGRWSSKDDDNAVCMVDLDDAGVHKVALSVWFWSVDKWVLDKMFTLDLSPCIDPVLLPAPYTVTILALVDGLVYLFLGDHGQCYVLSFCMQTQTLNKLFEDTFLRRIHPYIMAWPHSLLCHKEDSETKGTTVQETTMWRMMVVWAQKKLPLFLSRYCNHIKELWLAVMGQNPRR